MTTTSIEEYSTRVDFRMTSHRSRGVEGAMDALLNMPGRIVNSSEPVASSREFTIKTMEHYLNRLQMDPSSLSVIHVAGTKGKGSTCAFTESIIRNSNGGKIKTGMFTSPHLINVCERFRINGKPVPECVFLEHFWAIWDRLHETMDQAGEFPPIAGFFRFFTLLALRIFISEGVDVAILEVGLGGRLDATNVIAKPVVCGITTLDLDHTRVLGDTIDKIAREKAGILKPNVVAFTVTQEKTAALMLESCAIKASAPLYVVPDLSEFENSTEHLSLGLKGQYQRVNAALAIALSSTWLVHNSSCKSYDKLQNEAPAYRELVSKDIAYGLQLAFWPGRSQTVEDPLSATTQYYIDGAHTPLSMECCGSWYGNSVATTPNNVKVLIFNCHHERDVVKVLQPLLTQSFDYALFCPSKSCRPSAIKVPSVKDALMKANIPGKFWQDLDYEVADTSDPLYWQNVLSNLWSILNRTVVSKHPTTNNCKNIVCDSIESSVKWIRKECKMSNSPITDPTKAINWQVLVTGSLYIVGDTLSELNWKE